MRTPFRLTATLLRSQVARALRGRKEHLPLRRILVEDEGQGASARGGEALSAPLLWATGTVDPLLSPGIGKFTRQLQRAGHTVFLETDGMQLRRRIHEFQPDGHLYLTVRLYGTAHMHDRRMQRDGAFALALEGFRAAAGSGFLCCAHVVVEQETQLHEVSQLLEQLCAVKLDGMIITARDDAATMQRETAMAARGLIGSAWWASFSRLVQEALNVADGTAAVAAAGPIGAGGTQPPRNTGAGHARDEAVSSEGVAVQ
jgi:hypothetical protein